MQTFEEPSHCPVCDSKNIVLAEKVYKKDEYGEDTAVAVSGNWFCNDCGYYLGRKISRYQNDIDEKSL